MERIATIKNAVDGKKTYIVAIVMFLYAVVIEGWQNHNWQVAIDLVLNASGLGALRSALKKM